MANIKDHLNLMTKMGRTQGVDLGEARQRGVLDTGAFGDMLTTCRSCHQARTCGEVLNADAAPLGCPNMPQWTRLSALLRD